MKITEILVESPFVHAGQFGPKITGDGTISKNALARDYKFFGMVELITDEMVTLHELDDSSISIIGTVPSEDKNREKIVFKLLFKKKNSIVKFPKELIGKKLLQVDSAYGDKLYRNVGLGSYIYALLVKNGYVVISDNTQFEGGKNLWKTMARKAKLENYKVYILDDHDGFLEKDGEPVVYDGSNIDDVKIWSAGEDYSGFNIVLVLV